MFNNTKFTLRDRIYPIECAYIRIEGVERERERERETETETETETERFTEVLIELWSSQKSKC